MKGLFDPLHIESGSDLTFADDHRNYIVKEYLPDTVKYSSTSRFVEAAQVRAFFRFNNEIRHAVKNPKNLDIRTFVPPLGYELFADAFNKLAEYKKIPARCVLIEPRASRFDKPVIRNIDTPSPSLRTVEFHDPYYALGLEHEHFANHKIITIKEYEDLMLFRREYAHRALKGRENAMRKRDERRYSRSVLHASSSSSRPPKKRRFEYSYEDSEPESKDGETNLDNYTPDSRDLAAAGTSADGQQDQSSMEGQE